MGDWIRIGAKRSRWLHLNQTVRCSAPRTPSSLCAGAIHVESGSLRLSEGRLHGNTARLGVNTAAHASGGSLSILEAGAAILVRMRLGDGRAFGRGMYENAAVLAAQSKFWRDRRAAHVDCIGKLVLQECDLSDSSDAVPQPGDASAWIVARGTASVLLVDCTLRGSKSGTRMLRMNDAAEVVVRGCNATNVTVQIDNSLSTRLGIVNSTFSPLLDGGWLVPSNETWAVPVAFAATKTIWNNTEGRLCDPRAKVTSGPSGGVQCACIGDVSDRTERRDGSRCFRPFSVATALASRTVTMVLKKPTLEGESLQVSVQADGEERFTGSYTASSALVRRNGDRTNIPSEQVVVWNRTDVETVPLDAKAGVFTSRLLREFTVRLEPCGLDEIWPHVTDDGEKERKDDEQERG